ncbi:hypothetical protein HYX13_03645 [Candidatus Woesearchaeota archaeon]|nr:hypothetical protein [Candidatus Woesearchaeota archaeon]
MDLIELIKQERPFAPSLQIKQIISLESKAAISGESFQIIDAIGKKYKLRRCENEEKAKEIEAHVRRLPRYFPRFYGRDRYYLLFEWMDGELFQDMENISPEICYKVGKIMGEAHALEELDPHKKVGKWYAGRFREIKKAGILDEENLAKVQLFYKNHRKKLQLDVVLEFHDAGLPNLMYKEGRVYYVDEGGFGKKVKGLGLTKPLRWMKTAGQKEAFWRGYNEHYSSDYFDNDYQRFMEFLQLLRTLAWLPKKGRDVTEVKKRLLELIS